MVRGSTTIPVDFALTSSKKLVNEDINYINDRRCTTNKRKQVQQEREYLWLVHSRNLTN